MGTPAANTRRVAVRLLRLFKVSICIASTMTNVANHHPLGSLSGGSH